MTPAQREWLIDLTQVDTIEQLWSMHCDRMAQFGFDRLFYGFNRFRTARSLDDPNDFVVFSNNNPAYSDAFIGEGHYDHAPMVKWALENEGRCSWSVLSDMIATGIADRRSRPTVVHVVAWAEELCRGRDVGIESELDHCPAHFLDNPHADVAAVRRGNERGDERPDATVQPEEPGCA